MVTNASVQADIGKYLSIGMKMSAVIQFGPNNEYPLSCLFLGMKDKQFLIFEVSAKNMEDLIARKTKDTQVVIKGVADTDVGHVIAFKSQILGIKPMASWLMFVRYPRYTETREIREHKRFKVNIPAELKVEESTVSGRVIDISITGCRICFEQEVAVEKEAEVEIVSDEVDYLPDPLPKCIVASTRKYGGGTMVGITFDPPIESNDQLRLEVFKHLAM